MATVRYVGPARPGVEIHETGQWAEAGQPVDVDDELAERLCEQQGVWERADKRSKAADKGEGD